MTFTFHYTLHDSYDIYTFKFHSILLKIVFWIFYNNLNHTYATIQIILWLTSLENKHIWIFRRCNTNFISAWYSLSTINLISKKLTFFSSFIWVGKQKFVVNESKRFFESSSIGHFLPALTSTRKIEEKIRNRHLTHEAMSKNVLSSPWLCSTLFQCIRVTLKITLKF